MRPFFFSLLFFPFAALAAQFGYDLGLRQVSFSKQEFIAGDNVRIYAKVINYGTHDVKAFVSFWNGPQQVGNLQPISVRADGFAEEVFVDFVVPDNPFNIRAVIQAPEPADDNPSNDETLTTLITPIPDADRDGVPDDRDNCPGAPNADQTNTDNDAEGDACDEDDDNDGLTDEDEARRGTSQIAADTDSDGVGDAKDVFPLDSSKSALPPPPPPPPPPTPPPPPPSSTSVILSPDPGPLTPPSMGGVGEGGVPPSPLPFVPEQSPRLARGEVEGAPQIPEEESSFWNLKNRYFQGLVGLLLFGAGAAFVVERMIGRKYGAPMPTEEPPKTPQAPVATVATRSPVRRLKRATKRSSAKPPSSSRVKSRQSRDGVKGSHLQ